MIATLEATDDFRVLRRVEPLPPSPPATDGTAIAIAIDLETTGLDARHDEIIEIAMARVLYHMRAGTLLGMQNAFSALRMPSLPIPTAVSRLTGLHAADLEGREISPAAVRDFLAGARMCFSFNAAFDRPFAEAAWPAFKSLPWACSCTEVDWAEFGFEGRRLSHLVMQSGRFHDGHRAIGDVDAMLHILTLESAPFRVPAFLSLLETARTPTARVWAEGAPYASRARLKKRGYRWSDGETGLPRAWFRDVPLAAADAEVAFLRDEVLSDPIAEVPVVKVTAQDRYSDRAGRPTPRK